MTPVEPKDLQCHEVYYVTVQIDATWPDDRRVVPSGIYCDTWAEASASIDRALHTLPVDLTSVIVSRTRVDHFDDDHDPDLGDWPAARHIVTGPRTKEGC